jgi:hypothetical protein
VDRDGLEDVGMPRHDADWMKRETEPTPSHAKSGVGVRQESGTSRVERKSNREVLC